MTWKTTTMPSYYYTHTKQNHRFKVLNPYIKFYIKLDQAAFKKKMQIIVKMLFPPFNHKIRSPLNSHSLLG